jgi:hypothetical protein
MARLLESLRQLAHPAALRIDAPGGAALQGGLAELRQMLARPAALPEPVAAASAPADGASAADADASDDVFLAKLATLAWRMGHLAPKVTGSAPGRSLQNRVDALATLLRQQAVEIIDYSGQDFDPDEVWDELISGGLPADARPFIASMQLPRLRRHGRLLQRGIPIVRDRNEETSEGDPP